MATSLRLVLPTAVVAIVATAPEICCYDAEIDPGMVDYVHKIARVAPAASRSTPCYAPPIQGVSNTDFSIIFVVVPFYLPGHVELCIVK